MVRRVCRLCCLRTVVILRLRLILEVTLILAWGILQVAELSHPVYFDTVPRLAHPRAVDAAIIVC